MFSSFLFTVRRVAFAYLRTDIRPLGLVAQYQRVNINDILLQIHTPKEVLDEWQIRPQTIVSRYIKRYLQMKGRISLDEYPACVKSPRRFKLVQQESESYD